MYMYLISHVKNLKFVNLFNNVIAPRNVIYNIMFNNKIMSFLSGSYGIDCYRCYSTMNIINLRHPGP